MRASDRVDQIYVDEKIKNYIVEIVRQPEQHGLGHLGNLISVGCSPRGK